MNPEADKKNDRQYWHTGTYPHRSTVPALEIQQEKNNDNGNDPPLTVHTCINPLWGGQFWQYRQTTTGTQQHSQRIGMFPYRNGMIHSFTDECTDRLCSLKIDQRNLRASSLFRIQHQLDGYG